MANNAITVRRVFFERMARAGKRKALNARIREIKAETGKSENAASWVAMREFGYEGPKQEWAFYHEHLDALAEKATRYEEDKQAEERTQEEEDREFEEVVSKLPDSANVQVELDWIRSHPAMSRKHRQENPDDRVKIEVRDVYGSPSKAAVYALQNWCNDPEGFYKNLIAEHRKRQQDEAAEHEEVKDVGIAEAEKLLKEITEE